MAGMARPRVRQYDVECDGNARERLRSLAFDLHTVPVLVEGGKVVQVGWQGLSCTIE
jgi:hypothetical protein